MLNGTDKYTRAAEDIESGSLSKVVSEAISDIEIARIFSKHAAFKENALQMGQLGGSVAGYQFKSASAFQNFNKQMLKRMSEGKHSVKIGVSNSPLRYLIQMIFRSANQVSLWMITAKGLRSRS